MCKNSLTNYDNIELPCLTFMNNKLIKVSTSFIEMTEFKDNHILNLSLEDILQLLKINTNLTKLKNSESDYYLFNKSLKAAEVTIILKAYNDGDLIKLFFYEKPNSSLKNKFMYVNRLCEDNLFGVAVYSSSDLTLLNANHKYTSYWDAPFNNHEYCFGRTLSEIIPEWKGSKEESYWLDVISTGKTLQLKEFCYDKAVKGTTYWDYTVTPLYEDGKIKYLVHNSIDVTDRVLNRLRIEEQSRVITHQNEMLEKALIEQEEFFFNMSHELKTPLNVIFSTLQVLDLYTNYNTFNENKINKYKLIMKQNCYRLLRLINNLIDISKIDSGYINAELINLNIVNIVENISLSVADFIQDKGLTLVFDTDVEEKIIACNPDMIERILLNLLSNAIKFTDSGGEIKVTIFDKKEFVDIVVEDNGIGIPSDKLKIIFERFKQVDKSLNRDHEGSGIGLSLVKSLVELHKGIIAVNSSEGIGSKFIITLPAKSVEYSSFKAKDIVTSNNIERICIEFSDIYNLQE